MSDSITVKTASILGFGHRCRCAARRVKATIVDFLTPARRKVGATRHARQRVTLLLASLGLAAGMPPPANAGQWHPVGQIGKTAEDFLARHIGQTDTGMTLKAARLDPRLQLPLCSRDPQAFLQRGSKISGRMTVGVRCEGTQPWKVYVTVDVIVTEPVLVAARSLASGHLLTADDVTLATRDVSGLTAGYLSRPEEILGRRLKHSLVEGRVLTPAMMKADVVIRRGQSVTLTIRSKSLNISMEGKALMDGSVNQRIRVENSISRRVVEGVVRSPEHVEVLVF